MALHREEKDKILKDFAMHANDTGSTEIQIAMLTESIRQLTDHCKKFPKDASTKRGLLIKVCKRRGFLNYLKNHDNSQYEKLLDRLGLKK